MIGPNGRIIPFDQVLLTGQPLIIEIGCIKTAKRLHDMLLLQRQPFKRQYKDIRCRKLPEGNLFITLSCLLPCHECNVPPLRVSLSDLEPKPFRHAGGPSSEAGETDAT